MGKIALWIVFLFATYALIAFVMAFTAQPATAVGFLSSGPRNPALLCFAVIAWYLTGSALVKRYRSRAVADNQELRDCSTSSREHPLAMAFRRRPGLSFVFVVVLMALPLLSLLNLPRDAGSNGLSVWWALLMGEFVVLAGGIIAWIRLKPRRVD